MTKLFHPLLLLSLVTLAGCELYFGGSGGDDDDRWNYCANDGYYACQGDSCEWIGPRCPDDPNYTCTSDDECAAGCYCGTEGFCEEAGFCSQQSDCPEGFTCDVERSSCVPESCTTSADCDAGEYCTETGACEASCLCTTDAEAQAAGFGHCDETRGTCEPTPAAGSCGGTSTCNIAEPACAPGEVALISEGCYTGSCGAIATCDVTPGCTALQHESDCLGANASCSSVYTGNNCTKPDGSACAAGDTGCTCQSFSFNSCTDRTSAMMVFELPDGSFSSVLAN